MSKFRVVTEGINILHVDGIERPGLKRIPIWEGDHNPTVEELRNISASQSDIDTQSRNNPLAGYNDADKVVRESVGYDSYIPNHWPLVVQKRR
jgi:hypothetical protein